MILRLLISLALASLVTLSACSGSNNESPPPQPTQSPATSPAPAPQPGTTPTQDLTGHATMKNVTLSGISATFTAPADNPLGGQTQSVTAVDHFGGLDDKHWVTDTWNDRDIAASLPTVGVVTYKMNHGDMTITSQMLGSGSLNAEADRGGDIRAGETGELTVTANYSLAAIPGITSTGQVFITLWNITTNQMKGASIELPEEGTGTFSLTIHFNAGDFGSLGYGVSLRSQGTVVTATTSSAE